MEVRYIPFEEFWANRTQEERDAIIRDFGPIEKSMEAFVHAFMYNWINFKEEEGGYSSTGWRRVKAEEFDKTLTPLQRAALRRAIERYRETTKKGETKMEEKKRETLSFEKWKAMVEGYAMEYYSGPGAEKAIALLRSVHSLIEKDLKEQKEKGIGQDSKDEDSPPSTGDLEGSEKVQTFEELKESLPRGSAIEESDAFENREHPCSHSTVGPGDYHCTKCGKQLMEYRYKHCPNCETMIYERDWEEIPYINKRKGD